MSFTVLPFGATSTEYRRLHYPILLTDTVRDCSDAIDALKIFGSLISLGEMSGKDTTGFKAFDGHVGETACHIRAGMLLELHNLHSRKEATGNCYPPARLPISDYIDRLELLCKNAQSACLRITKENACPSTIGLGEKLDKQDKILHMLGWIEQGQYLSLSDSADAEWIPEDSEMTTRYLIAMYVLAKEYCNVGPSKRTVVRLQPKAAAAYGSKLISPFWDRSNGQYKELGSNRLDVRLAALQKWVSHLSCSWVRNWARRLSLSAAAKGLINNSIKESAKGLSAVAAYSGFLICRQVWAKNQWPLLLVDRHFCSHGYHLNAYVATLRQDERDVGQECHLMMNVCWDIEPVTFDVLLVYPKQHVPMISILGNSITGSQDDYAAKVCAASSGDNGSSLIHRHQDEQCQENLKHRDRFIATDHDRLSRAVLAEHRCYPFPLPTATSKDDDDSFQFLDIIRSSLPGHYIEQEYLNSKSEVNELGGGLKWMETFRWEHILAETPSMIASAFQNREIMGVFA